MVSHNTKAGWLLFKSGTYMYFIFAIFSVSTIWALCAADKRAAKRMSYELLPSELRLELQLQVFIAK